MQESIDLQTEELLQENVPVIDEAKVKDLQERVEEMRKELSDKVYAVSMDQNSLSTLIDIINNVEWKGKEALGIIEVSNRLKSIKKDGLKNGAAFLKALEIEASHYFLSKFTSKGSDSADSFMKCYKSLDQALSGVRLDNKAYEDLCKDLSAAQQGIEAV